MINEIKTEITKMILFYEEMRTQYMNFITELKKTDSTIDSSDLESLIQNITNLNQNLKETINTFDTSAANDSLEKLLSSIDKNINNLSSLEKTLMGDKLLGLLDQSREMHCIQWDYFETFEDLLKDFSANN